MKSPNSTLISRISVVALLFVAMLGLTACSYIVNMTAKKAAEVQTRKFKLSVHRVEGFAACLDTPGGMCPASRLDTEGATGFMTLAGNTSSAAVFSAAVDAPVPDLSVAADVATAQAANQVAADIARNVLKHDVQKQLDGIFNTVRGTTPGRIVSGDDNSLVIFEATQNAGATDASMNLTLESFQQYQEDIETATLLGGWDALAAEASLFSATSTNQNQERRKAYIKHYFDAYFRDGKFIKATVDGSKLKQKIVERLEERIPGLNNSDYEAMARKLFPQYKFNAGETNYVFGRIDDSGFVTRGGQKIAFPAIEASFALGSSDKEISDIDYVAVGSDLIRVLLHAIYDANMRLPAVEGATGLTAPIDPLVLNDPSVTHVDEENFERVQTRASQVEGVVSAGTGRLVRGVSFLSLNNEALATAIETAVGLAVRKQIEKVVWCWYACRLDKPNANGVSIGDYAATSFGQPITLTINVSGFAGNYELQGEAERQ